MMDDTVKTEFKGPGQWRSQAARLEKESAPKSRLAVLAEKARMKSDVKDDKPKD
jgi:hypothetical protein